MSAVVRVNMEDDATWDAIKEGLDKIFNGEILDVQMYMRIYSLIYSYCTSTTAIITANSGGLGGPGGAQRGRRLVGEELYMRLSAYLKKALTTIHEGAEELPTDQLLDYYSDHWDRFVSCSKFNHYIWRYLQQHWIKRQIDQGRKHIYEIFDLHLRAWKVEIFDTMNEVLGEILLNLVKRQRDGEYIKHIPRKGFVRSIVTLSKYSDEDSHNNEDEAQNQRLSRKWEQLFSSSTTEYYRKVSCQDLSECSPGKYIDIVERRILGEERNTTLFLPDHMKFSILRSCEDILITNHLDLYITSFNELLWQDCPSKLAQIYRILGRIPGGLYNCYVEFEKHVRQAGLQAVGEAVPLVTKQDEVANQRGRVNPAVFSESLATVIKKYQNLVQVAFNGDEEFNRSRDRSCRDFVNWNRACIYNSDAPELLAKYTESLLKRKAGGTVSESAILEKLSNSTLIFKYLEDKDYFITLYSRMLVKRLVQGSSSSETAERTMLTNLRDTYDHASKFKQMLSDIDMGKDLDARFEQWRSSQGSTLQDLSLEAFTFTRSFKVLSQVSWDLKPLNIPFIEPIAISTAHEEFTRFYQEEHPGQKLRWHSNLCNGEMRMHLKRGPNQGYTLHASAYQICILLLFNEKDELSHEDIQARTGLSAEILDPLLGVFLRIKLLKCAEQSSSKIYRVNDDFSSKNPKLDIRDCFKNQRNTELGGLHQKTKEERKLLMQATIVRIMKSRGKATYQQLAMETVGELQARFAPKDIDVKRCIDLLISKEFLERLDDGSLGYLA